MGVVQTFFCGNLKFEVSVIGTPPGVALISGKMFFSESIWIQRFTGVPVTPDDNPESRSFMVQAINKLITEITEEASRKTKPGEDSGITAYLSQKTVLDNLDSRLCYDVDHEFEPSHPKWLISDRSV